MKLHIPSWTLRLALCGAFLFMVIPMIADTTYILDEATDQGNGYLHFYSGILVGAIGSPFVEIENNIWPAQVLPFKFHTELIAINIIYLVAGTLLGAVSGLLADIVKYIESKVRNEPGVE